MGDKPAFRLYVADAPGPEGKFNFKRDGELCALWENTTRSGKPYFGGKLKDGRKIQLWPVEVMAEESPAVPLESVEPDDDVPF